MKAVNIPTGLLLAGLAQAAERQLGDFNWDGLAPSRDLQYVPCYSGLECARLVLPLDWFNKEEQDSHGFNVTLAIVKQPAVVPTSSPSFSGTVMVNPGGPGDSGVLHILRNGEYMQKMMDTDDSHYEVLSFDPRGMTLSLPSGDCFTNEVARALGEAQLGAGDKTTEQGWKMVKANHKAFSHQCAKVSRDKHGFAIQEYMSTAYVAADMLAMIDKIEEERYSDKIQGEYSSGAQSSSAQKVLRGRSDKPARLQYYGTSYGTYLGQVFMSMYPGRVHRMILDGVVVAEDYTAADWCPNLEDMDHAVDYFYQTCFDAGSKCPMYRASDSSWKDVKERITQFKADLDADPIITSTVDGIPGVITGDVMWAVLANPVYAPLILYESAASILGDALNGNYTALISSLGMDRLPDACAPTIPSNYAFSSLAGMAVRITDGDDLRSKDFKFWQEYIARCEAFSPEIGLQWADPGAFGWDVRPRYRYTGPFKAPAPDASQIEGKPSAPILFLSSRYDPVTPLHSAYTASQSFPGSSVVMQKSVGHCTLLGSPSRCTFGHIGHYLKTGEVPKNGTECEGDCVPWKKCPYDLPRLPR